MRLLHRLRAGLRVLFDRSSTDRDLDDEVAHFYAEAEAELVARGVAPDEARRRVRLRFGDTLTAREDVRGHGWENVVESLWIDGRIALRRLGRAPAFSGIVVLTVALGIGSATAIFSVVRPVLLDPLGYPGADRIVALTDRTPDGSPLQVTFGTYREIAERTRVFDALSVSRAWAPIATDGGRPERLTGLMVGARHFDVLGVPPAIGPGFDPAEDHPDGTSTVILSDGLWRRMYGADPGIVGATVRLNDAPHTVVGVLPPHFRDAIAPRADVWTLLRYDAALPSFDGREWGHHLDMIGRVSAGSDLEGTRRAVEEVAVRPLAAYARPAWAAMEQGLDVRPLHEAVVADVRPTMLALVGAVTLLLVIACANVTVLLLAWGARREGELAMRVALGAGRGRLLRQLLAESVLLAGLGGVVGLAVTALGSAALARLVPPSLQSPDGVGVDAGAFLFALVITSFVGVAVGLVPALTLSGSDLHGRARGVGRGGHHGTRRVLVVAEVALALVLLVGTGLLMRSVGRLFSLPTGIRAEGLLVMQVQTVGLDGADEAHRFFDLALEAVRAEPGVTEASLTSQLPLSGDRDQYGVSYEDVGEVDDVDGAANRYAVEAAYFEAMGVPLLTGRGLSDSDMGGAPPAIVVSESLASRAFGGGDPIGRRMHVGSTDLPAYTVVGVVGNVTQSSLGSTDTDAVYVTPRQWHFRDAVRWIVVRHEGAAAPTAESLRRAVWSVDPDQAILRVERMDELVASSESRRRFVLGVLQTFGALALVLAAVGLYGVLSRSVTERMREFGVRAALGANRRGIVGLAVRQGLALTLVGIGVGLLVATAASRMLTTLLFGVSPLDPLTYVSTALILGLVATVACAVPAIRAGRVDPLETLRGE